MPRYRDLQPEVLIDVGARSAPSGAESAARELAASLNAFSRNAMELSSTRINRNLADAGEQAGAATDGTPELKKGIVGASAWGRAYNDAALRSYAIRQEADLEAQAARLQVEAGTDPEAFSRSMEAMREGVLEEAPAKAKALLNEMYVRRTAAGLAQINQALAQELRDEDAVLVEQQVETMSDRIARLRSQDTLEAHQLADEEEERLFVIMESAKADRTWTEAEHRQAVRTIERKIISDTVKQRFINELESPYGDPIGFIEDLKDINRKSERLLPEEEQALENELLAELRERSALRSMRESQADAESEAISERTDRELTAELLGGTLTTRKLFDATAGGLLDPARALTLSNALDSQVDSPRKSDPETLATYETNLIRLSEDEIWSDPALAWDDKSELVQSLRDLQAGWQGEPRAKEGYNRLERTLDIQQGTPLRSLSAAELEALDIAKTEYFDAMEEIPPEKREAKALQVSEEIAQRVIKRRQREELELHRKQLRIHEELLNSGTLDEYSRRTTESDAEAKRNLIRELEARVNSGGNQ